MKIYSLAFSLATVAKNGIIQHTHSGCQLQRTRPRPLSPAFMSSLTSSSGTIDESPAKPPCSSDCLNRLGSVLGATPQDLLRLETTPDGVRGVYLNSAVKENEILLRLPLESCLRDDEPPAWFGGGDHGDTATFHSSAWATRLAVAMIDLQLHPQEKDLWLKLLPDASYLRASLPIHWSDETISSARCSALELAVDSAYFARADAVEEILTSLKEILPTVHDAELKSLCNDALDLVQTRSCRVDLDGVPVRLLAPIFDFINHASSKSSGCTSANAAFSLEGVPGEDQNLVVRATVNLDADAEILIDYGDAARPSWRCLTSYGFIPDYSAEQDGEDSVAELWVSGVRYEVGPSTIPVDLVEAMQTPGKFEEIDVEQEPEAMLTPDVALRVAERATDVAFQLLLDLDSTGDDLELEDDSEDDEEEEDQDPADIISARLAASLRWAQHRTLLACAAGLREWAAHQAVKG